MDKNRQAIEIFNKNAELYREKYMNVDAYSISLDLFCDTISKKGANILELACGPGNVTKYLLEKRPDFNILATDLATEMLRLTKIENPTIKTQILDCRKITSIGQNFDAIMCGFVLPYLSKEEALQLIKDSAAILNPGGLLYISTMEDDYEKSGLIKASTGDEVYMYYHEAGYLEQAMTENGLRLIHQNTQPAINGDTDLVMIAQKLS